MRVFAISDLHVDYKENLAWVAQLSDRDFCHDVLLLAGDVSNRTERMAETLGMLRRKFARVFFVPGNHDLWVKSDNKSNSLVKFYELMDLCVELGVETEAARVAGVRIVPLFSWYEKPEEGSDSLFVAKEGEDPTLSMWSDNRLILWPASERPIAQYFLDKNPTCFDGEGVAITFSHFLPRQELIFGSRNRVTKVKPSRRNPHPEFNFSRVAGTAALDRQLRALGSILHVYGHQHLNRWWEIDGVTYVSHCLGYQRERKVGIVCGLDEGPRLVWED
ncbi:MAG: metallophosphoesterase [Candidatus Latescibacteria bacterium]|nr:metallophosphoesterase [Candidatus Latescibacterota bacterium]